MSSKQDRVELLQGTLDLMGVAVGATPAQIVGLVMGEGLVLALTGIAIGTVGALAIGRVGASLLFEVPAADPSTFVGVIVLLGVVALAASCIPARRAAGIDPNSALRQE